MINNPNPCIPGRRVIGRNKARKIFLKETGCEHWFYPLSEIDDLGIFCYIEKLKESDTTNPWAYISHPFVKLYFYILKGSGDLFLGGSGSDFKQETYHFSAEDMLIVPRGVPYRITGEWKGISFHSRTNVFGKTVGTAQYSFPIIVHKRLAASQNDSHALPINTLCYMNSILTKGIRVSYYQDSYFLNDPNSEEAGFESDFYFDEQAMLTDNLFELQTEDERNVLEMMKNPDILGARVLHKSDAEHKYNEADQNDHYAYPLGWTDDFGIFIPAKHSESTDEEKPASSHCHPDIQEFKFVLNGRGQTALGYGDPAFETEWIPFERYDLVITPRDVPHCDSGNYEAIFFHVKNTAFGVASGSADCPHRAITYIKPDNAIDNTIGPARMLRMNSRETYAQVLARPIYERLTKDEF